MLIGRVRRWRRGIAGNADRSRELDQVEVSERIVWKIDEIAAAFADARADA